MPESIYAAQPAGPDRDSARELILVTGGTGLIGKAVVDRLARNYGVLSLDREPASNDPDPLKSYKMDLASEEDVHSVIARIKSDFGSRIASVVHLAAYYDFEGRPSDLYDEITVKGSERLIEALKDKDLKVEQFIFSSSLLVYAPQPPQHKITEESPLLPKWDYPESKVKAQKVIQAENEDIPVVILRIAGVYNDEGHSIPITNHIQRIYEKQISSHFYPGNLSYGNPFVHLDDLVEAIELAIKKRKQLPHETVINIGEDVTLSYGYLQNEIGMLLHNRKWKTYKILKLMAKIGAWIQNLFGKNFIKPWMIDLTDDHMEIDISKARELLGWEPKHSLKQTLPKIIASLKKDPEAWLKVNKLK